MGSGWRGAFTFVPVSPSIGAEPAWSSNSSEIEWFGQRREWDPEAVRSPVALVDEVDRQLPRSLLIDLVQHPHEDRLALCVHKALRPDGPYRSQASVGSSGR